MSVSNDETHLVYLLKRKSDKKQYVGITIQRQLRQRMGNHKRSVRFREDSFDVTILEESFDRKYIEEREEYWIDNLNTFTEGLNDTASGKGWGHNSPNFTTLGYIYSDESRKKMSDSAKERAVKEGFDVRSQRSKENFKNPDYMAKQKAAKKGKRLRPPKLSDDMVLEIRDFYNDIVSDLETKCEVINEERQQKNSSWSKTNPAILFANTYKDKYNCSVTLLRDIVLWKTRTEVLPSLYGKNSQDIKN